MKSTPVYCTKLQNIDKKKKEKIIWFGGFCFDLFHFTIFSVNVSLLVTLLFTLSIYSMNMVSFLAFYPMPIIISSCLCCCSFLLKWIGLVFQVYKFISYMFYLLHIICIIFFNFSNHAFILEHTFPISVFPQFINWKSPQISLRITIFWWFSQQLSHITMYLVLSLSYFLFFRTGTSLFYHLCYSFVFDHFAIWVNGLSYSLGAKGNSIMFITLYSNLIVT